MLEQPDLFTMVRPTDPDTSVAAARSVLNMTAKRQAVLDVARMLGTFTLEQLVSAYHVREHNWLLPRQSESGIRTRCSELQTMGYITDTGERAPMTTGRMARVLAA